MDAKMEGMRKTAQQYPVLLTAVLSAKAGCVLTGESDVRIEMLIS